MNICAKCQNFSGGDIWYHQYCGAPEVRRKQGIDPVTGANKYIDANDPGRICFTDEARPHCREINHSGDCPHFKSMILRAV